MTYKGILSLLAILLLFDCYLFVQVKKFSLSDGSVPEKGRDISMSCEVEISADDGILTLIILKGDTKIADCFMNAGNVPCSKTGDVSTRYTFSNNQPSVITSITNLQIADGGNWYCGFQTTGNTLFTLMVYSSPVSVVLSGSSVSEDLSIKKVDLICKTSNCVYPAPGNIQWFYRKEGDSWFSYPNSTAIPAKETCSGSEKIYSSTLSLARNTVWPLQPTNTDITVKFQCRLDFPTLTTPLVSNKSNNVRYAVQVMSVVLKDGNTILSSSETISIASGSSKLFTCTTSTSRPSSTIVWYIGSTSRQKNTSTDFRYTAAFEDNNKNISCKAFNIQNEVNAVSSSTPRLNVLVKVTSVILAEGNSPINNDVIKVTQNQLKTLTCKTGETNPTAIIMWYVGNNLKQNGTDKNYSFTPTNADHDEIISCKAYNTQPPEFIESAKPKLFVQVPALLPSLTNWTSGNPEFYSGDQITLTCKSTPTRPAVNVIWKKGTTQLQNVQNITSEDLTRLFTVTSTVTFTPQKNDNGSIISCEMYITNQNPQKLTKSIVVWWPPSSALIPTNSFPWLEGQQNKILTCHASDYGNPSSDITWKTSVGIPMSNKIRFQVLIQDYNGKHVSCQLSNKYTQKMNVKIHSPEIQLNVMYKPDVFVHVDGEETYNKVKNEGESLIAICSAKGNPVPSVQWQKRVSDNAKLEFKDIDRKDNGVYTCSAKASSSNFPSYDFSNETSFTVTVNYAPNVTINLSDPNLTEYKSLLISCVAVGRPNRYTYTSMAQSWGEIDIPNSHKPNNGIIDIENLQLQDSGTYTCLVNNGVYDRSQQLDQMAKTTILVKVSPKIMHDGESKFAGLVGTSVNITIPFYSYPDIVSVAFKFENGSEIKNSEKHKVFYKESKVTDMFYGQKVELDGNVAVLYIMDEDESDFKNYTLVLQNGIGQPTEWIFKHVSESVPLPPLSFSFDGIVNGVPTFTLVGGFNGGSDQTFIVETAVDGTENWKERVRFNESDKAFLTNNRNTYSFNLTGLGPNKYDVRVLTENSKGRIEETKALFTEFTITSDDNNGGGNMALIGGLCGGGAALILILVLVVIAFKRRGTFIKGKAKRYQENSDRKPVNEDDDDYGMQDNPMYVSAGPRGQAAGGSGGTGAVYSTVDKKKHVPDSNKNDVYAEVDKTRKSKESVPDNVYSMPVKQKGKKEKEKKEKNKHGNVKDKKGKKATQEGDIYENATPANQAKNDEIIYENPEPSKEVSKKNVNKDGLIYADLTFNDQPKGQKKLVIHGLDDMTEYVQVDFTKKAEPLPDSDDENNPPK